MQNVNKAVKQNPCTRNQAIFLLKTKIDKIYFYLSETFF